MSEELDDYGSNSARAWCFRLVEETYGKGLRGHVAKAIQKVGADVALDQIQAHVDEWGDDDCEIRTCLGKLSEFGP